MIDMFWERFSQLCEQNNTKPNPVGKLIGISSGIITKWKTTDSIPNGETLRKIADYFNVSTDYLLGRTDDPNSLESLDEQLTGVEFALYGEVKEMTEEEKQDVLDYIRYKKSKKKNS